MASSVETLLKLELQANGENNNTWGTKNNTNLQLLANAIAKRQALTLGASNVTLTDTQFADNEARSLALDCTGVLSANVQIIIPQRSKMYLVRNACTGSFTVTIGASGGSTATITQASIAIVWCDGTNTTLISSNATGGAIDASTLGGVAAALYARLDVSQNWTKGQAVNFVTITDGGTITADCTLSNKFYAQIAGNRTLALSNPKDGQEIELWIQQDGAGSRTLTWPANVSFVGGTPVLTTAASAIDVFKLTYKTSLNQWICAPQVGSSSGTSTVLVLSGNEVDLDLYARSGSPGGVVTVSLTIPTGVLISASCVGTPALDLSGFAAGSTINVINNGYIIGKGGDGSDGTHKENSDGHVVGVTPGQDGGDAIKAPGVSITCNITNGSGFIWGGGGGGGGGGAAPTGSNGAGSGGGGGGGAGGGKGGQGKYAAAQRGGDGSTGRNGTFGAGGTGAVTAGTAGTGGAGGDFGVAGSTGTSTNPGTGGAAGKAIELNGGSVNFLSGSGSPNVEGAVS
jgi:hypothetical protein